jgi:hypothetical protein
MTSTLASATSTLPLVSGPITGTPTTRMGIVDCSWGNSTWYDNMVIVTSLLLSRYFTTTNNDLTRRIISTRVVYTTVFLFDNLWNSNIVVSFQSWYYRLLDPTSILAAVRRVLIFIHDWTRHFFEPAGSLFSLTLKVFVTNDCIEIIQKSDKKGLTQCHTKIHPM